jgi:riboflavin synthase
VFTGIIQDIGRVAGIEAHGEDLRMAIAVSNLRLERQAIGDSIAVSGVCLTVCAFTAQGFAADLSRETLDVTTAGSWQVGQPVNLEPALRLGDALGGHLVSGHVDGVAELLERSKDERSERLRFRVPRALGRYIARKGSVTLDGVSLTVNDVAGDCFGVNLIPHTLMHTTLGTTAIGAGVNLEVDQMARYAERLLGDDVAGEAAPLRGAGLRSI